MAQQLIRLPNVKAITGLCSSAVYRLAADGSFPKPVKITKRSSGWVKSEVDQWINERIKASRPDAAEA